MQQTPHSWSTQTLQCFPPVLADYFQQNQVPRENKQHLRVRKANALSANAMTVQELISVLIFMFYGLTGNGR